MFTGVALMHAGVAHTPASAVLKLTPVTVIVSPTTPLDFERVILGMTTRVTGIRFSSPRLPATVTSYVPCIAVDFRTNDPVTCPADIVHVGAVTIPPVAEITQLVSAVLKPDPVILIVSPALPIDGDSIIEGGSATVNVAEADKALTPPDIVIL
ncbi:MAG: hypothetical protein ABSA81_03610 [Candidatus Bathyarchaeia archaeon]|jgi:hypothetical protein